MDYQYAFVASNAITNEDELTAFFGFWLSNLSFVSLLFQFFFTSRILKKFGIATSLHFLPLGIILGSIGIILSPQLLSAVMIKVTEGSFKQSINKSGMELLYLPIPSREKINSKAFIDVSVDGFATGLAGLLLIISASYLNLPIQVISLFVILFVMIWIYLIHRVREEYINSFRMAIEKRNIDFDQLNLNLDDASIIKMLQKNLESSKDRQIVYVLKLLDNVTSSEFVPSLKKLLKHPSPEINLHVINILRKYKDLDISEEIAPLCHENHHQLRIAAMRYILQKSSDPAMVAYSFLDSDNVQTISSAIIAVGLEYRENDSYKSKIDVREIIDRHLKKSTEISLSDSEVEFIKINLAIFIGIINVTELNSLLFTFLHDKSLKIVRSAIESAGSCRDPVYLPVLFKYLGSKKLRNFARRALIEYGEE